MDNRSLILLKALELFSARGYDAVGIQEIVDAAGITKPTLYHYFGSKQGLLDTLVHEYGGRLNQMLEQAAQYQGDLPLTLYRLANVYFNFAKENQLFYRMQMAMWFAPPESEQNQVVKTINVAQHKLIEDLFIKASQDHGNMKGRHLALAATFVGTMNTYIGIALNNYVSLNEELVYKAVHQFMHGIYS